MTKFVMTPAIKWLEDNWLANVAYDDASNRGILSFKIDHSCEWYEAGRCNWEEQDAQRMDWVSPGVTEEDWMNSVAWEYEADDFEDTLATAEQSPFLKSIAQ